VVLVSWCIVGVLTVVVAGAIRGQIREIAARNDEIAASREQYRALIETTQAIPWEMEPGTWRFTYVGPQAKRLLDAEPERWLEPGFFARHVHPDDREPVLAQYREAAESHGEKELEFRLVRATTGTVWVRSIVSGQRDGGRLRGMLLDVTERRQLEFGLHQAQKLESVGRLASGIAHEINTPIQFVSDSVHFVRESMADLTLLIQRMREVQSAVLSDGNAKAAAEQAQRTEEQVDLPYLVEHLPKALDRALDGLERVATIVRSMKAFAHPDQREMAMVDLNQAIASTLTIARNEYKYVAEVETGFGEIPPVRCLAGEVNQAILNVVVNAAHAVADAVRGSDRKGRIVVRTARDGDEVVVTIRDTGTGIPAAIRDRIFEPFFTTKEVGKGTGQGLAIARSVVVEKHGGELTFETEVGKGTTFFIRLPIAGVGAPLPA
jgi:PAS domain S-box-containing protein